MKFLLLLILSFPLLGAETPGKLIGGASLVDKTMNPAISVNGLLLGAYGNLPERTGLMLQEVEAQFTAAIDPYFMGNFIATAEGTGKLGVEEAYFSTLSIPHVTIKGGKFLAAFGKNNLVHTHAQPLVDRPLISKTFLGDDGFNSVGVEGSFLVPTKWFFEFTASAMTASKTIDSTPFLSESPEAMAGVFRMDHLLDLSDVTTLGLGASYTIGDGKITKKNVQVYGGDATVKYVSGKGKGDFAISWINEFMQAKRAGYSTLGDWEDAKGFYSTLLFRFSPRFWIGGRLDYLKVTDTDLSTVGDSLIVAYVPSEFSAIRLQGSQFKTTNQDSKWQVLLQYNMTIGSHPAHAY